MAIAFNPGLSCWQGTKSVQSYKADVILVQNPGTGGSRSDGRHSVPVPDTNISLELEADVSTATPLTSADMDILDNLGYVVDDGAA